MEAMFNAIIDFIAKVYAKVQELLGSVTVLHGYENPKYRPGYVEESTTL